MWDWRKRLSYDCPIILLIPKSIQMYICTKNFICKYISKSGMIMNLVLWAFTLLCQRSLTQPCHSYLLQPNCLNFVDKRPTGSVLLLHLSCIQAVNSLQQGRGWLDGREQDWCIDSIIMNWIKLNLFLEDTLGFRCAPKRSSALLSTPVSILHSGFLYPLLCRTPRRPAVT